MVGRRALDAVIMVRIHVSQLLTKVTDNWRGEDAVIMLAQ